MYAARLDYLEKYSFYDVYISRMFGYTDVKKTIHVLEMQNKKAAKELESLCKEFKEQISEPYENINKEFMEVFKNYYGSDLFLSLKDYNQKYAVYKERIFSCNLQIAHHFQKQPPIKGLDHQYDELKKCFGMNNILPELIQIKKERLDLKKIKSVPIWEHTIYKKEKLIPLLQALSSEMEDGSDINYNSLWYRGETAAEGRDILPSLFRDFTDKKNSVFKARYGTMRNFLEQAVEEFRFRADGAKEMSGGFQYTLTEYVTLLQHYEVHTNFLDWSEDAFTSLYFALEKYLNSERLNGEENPPKRDVKIILFDPRKYNNIRSELLRKFYKSVEREKSQLEIQKNLNDRIPNLSVLENQKLFQEFLPFMHEKETTVCLADGISSQEMERIYKKMRYLPVAVWASRVNDRINAQSGTFLAFNLDTPEDICKEMSLEKIQEDILTLWKCEKIFYGEEMPVFMHIVRIDKRICLEIADWLRSMGMSTERLYPELKNIGKRVHHVNLPLDRLK